MFPRSHTLPAHLLRRAQRGSSLVELSVALPLLMLMTIGTVDFARVWAISAAVENAAQAGAQYGAQTVGHSRDASGIAAKVQDDLSNSVAAGQEADVLVTRTCLCSDGTATDCDAGVCSGKQVYVGVRVETEFQTIFDYPGVPDDIEVAREARMRAR